MPEPQLQPLEERITWLQRHVVEQDKAMLELGDELARLREEVKAMRARLAGLDEGAEPSAPDERPPHY
jgi:SlyX protein